MKILVKTKGLSQQDWLRYRTKGIGGSDVSIIAGVNPFKSAYQLWLEKTGQIEPEQTDSEFAHFGTVLEPVIRKEFTARTGIKVRAKHMILQSSEYPFMLANLDGVVSSSGKMELFEAKTASAYKQDIWEKGVPAQYILQVQHYMSVTGAEKTYVAALVGGNRFFYHEIARDDAMIEKIIAMEQYFWENYVVNGIEPAPDGSHAATEYFNAKFPISNGKSIELPEEALPICEEYEKLSAQLKAIEAAKNAAGNQIKRYMRDHEIGTVGGRKITWKSVSGSTVDTKRLKNEKPEIYNAYLTDTHYRRLSIS